MSSESGSIVPSEDGFCMASDDEENGFCGEDSNKKLLMPFDIPDLPMCDRHAEMFADWTEADTIRELVEMMTEEESIDSLKEDLDGDF